MLSEYNYINQNTICELFVEYQFDLMNPCKAQKVLNSMDNQKECMTINTFECYSTNRCQPYQSCETMKERLLYEFIQELWK